MSVDYERMAWYLVSEFLLKHPLPWHIEQDWTLEVIDSNGNIVIKCMSYADAQAIVDEAIRLDDEKIAFETTFEGEFGFPLEDLQDK